VVSNFLGSTERQNRSAKYASKLAAPALLQTAATFQPRMTQLINIPSTNRLLTIKVWWRIAKFPGDRRRFGWSDAPSRRTGLQNTLDCR